MNINSWWSVSRRIAPVNPILFHSIQYSYVRHVNISPISDFIGGQLFDPIQPLQFLFFVLEKLTSLVLRISSLNIELIQPVSHCISRAIILFGYL